MTTIALWHRASLALALTVGSLNGAQSAEPAADVPDLSQPIVFAFNRTNIPVWFLSGDYTFAQPIKGAQLVNLVYSLSLTHDSKGKIEGQGTTIVNVGNSFLAGDFVAHGRVSGGFNQPSRMNLSVRIKGNDVLGGQPTAFNISLTYKLDVDVDNMALIGTCRGSANFAKGGGGSVKSEVFIPLPANATGNWAVQLDLVPLSKLSGTGTIYLLSGSTLDTTANGDYSSTSGLAKVNLRGKGTDSQGTTLNLKFTPSVQSGNLLEQLNGRIYGQKVKF